MSEQEPRKQQDRLSFIMTVTAVALVVFMIVFIPINPLKKYRRSLMNLEATQQKLDSTVMVRDAHLERLRDQEILMKRLNERQRNFDLFSFVNTVLMQENLRDERASLRKIPAKLDKAGEVSNQVTMVKLDLTGVSLKELANVLHKVYSSNNLIVIYQMTLRPEAKTNALQCDITFLSPNAGAVAS